MKLTKRSSSKKMAYLGVVMFLILSSASPGSAVIYHYEEDFSNELLPGWKFGQVDFSGVPTVTTDHTFTIENETLVSTGNFDITKENFVFVEDNTSFGAWSFDLYLPSSLTQGQDHSIMMTKQALGFETLYAIFALHIDRGSLTLTAANGSADDNRGRTISVSVIEYDKYQHYDLIRTTDRFYVLIDKKLALNMTFTFNLDTIKYLGIIATQGSNVRFDNLQITTDGTDILNEIIDTGDTTTLGSDTSESSSSNEALFLTIGLGATTLTVGAFSGKYFKKKRITKLVKISSNGKYPQISDTISRVFNYKKSIYFLLLGHKNQNANLLNKNIEASLKSEMNDYRHLLHPFRLSIMQLLQNSPKITSIEIREKLEMGWSDYYSAVRQLEKLKLIRIFDDFDDDGAMRQFVIMEQRGANEYSEFIELIEKFVGISKEKMQPNKYKDLYPENN